MKRAISFFAFSTIIALAVTLALTLGVKERAYALPGVIPAGYDLFETEPGETYIDPLPISANFGGQGCDAFAGHVDFAGVPIDSFAGHTGLSPTDTIVRRMTDGAGTIPIEIVALSLVSVSPITLTGCTGGPQLWNVSATIAEGDTMQTPGQMTIRYQYVHGGTFDSTLPVNPVFTFTRVSDQVVIGSYRLSDLGPIPPFQTTNASWCRNGNPLDDPAGDVIIEEPGLTTRFAPGVICPDSAGGGGMRKKVLTSHEMLLAKHGVKPAEKKAIYKCYIIPGQDPPDTVNTTTQFGSDTVAVGPGHYFCPSAIKNSTKGSRDPNETPIECYDIAGSDPPHVVNLHDQFSTEMNVPVGAAELLCVPALKQVGPQPLKPYYVCYDTPGVDPPDIVSLQTQFGLEPNVPVGAAVYLCAPAFKNTNGGPENVPHLRCYLITDPPPGAVINIFSQFGPQFGVPVGMPELLCVPVKKTVKYPSGPNPAKLPYPGDTDGDRCPDQRENGPYQGQGGLRDYQNDWDYMNPTQDGLNRVDDVLAVVNEYFDDDPPGANNVDYTSLTDRTAIPGGFAWSLGPPNGQQRVDDILAIVKQYFHDCL